MGLPLSKLPAHPLAKLALAVSGVAAGLALYGAFVAETHLAGSPLNAARGRDGLPSTRDSEGARVALQVLAFVLPLVLGLAAGWLGASAMGAIERARDRYSGSFRAVFAILIGGLAAVVGGCMTFAVFAWRYMPAWDRV